MKKVLITGVMGFIGFHLCQRLLNNGFEVIGIDTLEGAKNHQIFEEKRMLIGRNANFHFYDESINQLPLLGLLSDVDVVYHLAATTTCDAVWDELQATIQNNVEISKRLVNSCQEKSRLIFTSTIEVYGQRTGEITEKTPTNPISPYGLTKLAGESIILREKQHKNVNVNILRLPTVYGPWQRQDMAFHQLLYAKIVGKQLDASYDRSTVDLLYVDDVVEALILAGTCCYENEIFNLSSGKDRQWYQAKALILGEEDRGWNNELQKVYVSGQKAKQLLKFEPKISIQDGVKKQQEHIIKYLELYKSSARR